MENYAKRLAIEHNVQGKINKKNYPIYILKENFSKIQKAYNVLSESVYLDISIPPSGEWILDNFYIIEEQVNIIQKELKIDNFIKLPAIKGQARIYILARELVYITDGNVTKENIRKFINAYSTKRKLSMEEIWVFPVMLKICLIDYIKQVCDRIIISQYQKFKVASLVERIIKNEPLNKQLFSKYRNINLNGEISTYVEFLVFLLKKEGKSTKKYIDILSEEIKKAGTTLDDVIKIEHYDMALRRVSISNSITSIKNILRYNWTSIFEEINGIEIILNEDIWYKMSDFDTKNLYRNEIKKLSKKSKLSESYISSELLELAKKENKHIGEYLIGEERKKFLNKLGIKTSKPKSISLKLFLYLISIYLPTIFLSFLILREKFYLALIPISEIFVLLINKIICKMKKPKIIPKLEYIPEDVSSFVIVPTLLNDKEKVKEIFKNIESYYISNKIPNLYFALLGDCTEINTEESVYDREIIEAGVEEAKRLNKKYDCNNFFFLYRKRIFNTKQNKWLGYERKRGMITEFVEFLLFNNKGSFVVNTITNIPEIKYVITLDADTNLTMDTAKKLIGTMEHPMNTPVVENKIVVKGYGLIQPKVGIDIESSTASLFSKIYAGDGGIDVYSTAESNVYQDLFGEAIFTGKGIFNIKIFNELLKNEIPENTVLSHDLLEGSYLRCGLASDIEVIDGFPSKVNSYMLRLHRWTRGDWQIIKWLFKSPLNKLSKYKIFDNLRRSCVDIFLLLLIFLGHYELSIFIIFFPFIIDCIEKIFNHNNGIKTKNYLPIINGIQGSFLKSILSLLLLPYKAVLMLKAIFVTLYRMIISKKHLLEWTTSADAEKSLGDSLKDFIKEMIVSPIIGIALILSGIYFNNINIFVSISFFILWTLTPIFSYLISKPSKSSTEKLSKNEDNEIKEIATRTWNYFNDYMNIENNFLPPDNFQYGRKKEIVNTTSSTNIGLGLMAIISAYDMKFIDRDTCIYKLKNSIDTIEKLEKWHGHLINWYNTKNLEPLNPKFISTVDSGNFVGYLYTVRKFFEDNGEEEYRNKVNNLIDDTDFSYLYDADKNLFSIGYDIRENKLVDSYYDLLASEARLASFIAIAKKDIPYKHWFNMSRTLTTVDKYKGLVSWSGTMFEYFMPIVIMKPYKYTLLDETYDFCINSQIKYAKKLNVPWGISEAAFNLQDLNLNYQYKAFGIPWLGLKRGLKEEVVVSPYSSLLALSKEPREVYKNIIELKKYGCFDKYGFYDSIDFTPNRVGKNKYEIVKTYMAHHEALILLSINNYLNENILQKRFMSNPEIRSINILLQEKIPSNVVFTKSKKEKIRVLKYKNYEEHAENVINTPCGNVNIMSNNNYTLLINDYGEGYAVYDNLLLTKNKDGNRQGICFYIKDLETGEVISNTLFPKKDNVNEYEVKFSSSETSFYRNNSKLEINTKIAVSPEDDIEVRCLEIKNISEKEMNLDVISYVEPVLSNPSNDIVHPAYNNLFVRSSKYGNGIILEKRFHNDKIYYLNFLLSNCENKQEFELDKSKIIGRLRDIKNPIIEKQDVAFSNENNVSTNTIISFKQNIKLANNESRKLIFYYGVSRKYDDIISMYNKYNSIEMAERLFELAYSKSLVENRFLGYKGKDIIMFNKLFSIIGNNHTKEKYKEFIRKNILKQCDLWKYGISGDLPIIMIRINRVNDIYVIKDLIMAIEYYFKKNLLVDLIILNEEENKYEQYVQDRLYEVIGKKGLIYLLNKNGGIHIIKKYDITLEEERLLYACSDLILNSRDGFLKEQLYEGE